MATAHHEDGSRSAFGPTITPRRTCMPGRVETWLIRILSREVIEVRRMKPADIVRAVRIVAANEALLMQAWRDIHGET